MMVDNIISHNNNNKVVKVKKYKPKANKQISQDNTSEMFNNDVSISTTQSPYFQKLEEKRDTSKYEELKLYKSSRVGITLEGYEISKSINVKAILFNAITHSISFNWEKNVFARSYDSKKSIKNFVIQFINVFIDNYDEAYELYKDCVYHMKNIFENSDFIDKLLFEDKYTMHYNSVIENYKSKGNEYTLLTPKLYSLYNMKDDNDVYCKCGIDILIERFAERFNFCTSIVNKKLVEKISTTDTGYGDCSKILKNLILILSGYNNKEFGREFYNKVVERIKSKRNHVINFYEPLSCKSDTSIHTTKKYKSFEGIVSSLISNNEDKDKDNTKLFNLCTLKDNKMGSVIENINMLRYIVIDSDGYEDEDGIKRYIDPKTFITKFLVRKNLNFFLYNTHSNDTDKGIFRWRCIIPLSNNFSVKQYNRITKLFNESSLIKNYNFDISSYQANRRYIMPNFNSLIHYKTDGTNLNGFIYLTRSHYKEELFKLRTQRFVPKKQETYNARSAYNMLNKFIRNGLVVKGNRYNILNYWFVNNLKRNIALVDLIDIASELVSSFNKEFKRIFEKYDAKRIIDNL